MLRDADGGEPKAAQGASRAESSEDISPLLHAIAGHYSNHVPLLRTGGNHHHHLRRRCKKRRFSGHLKSPVLPLLPAAPPVNSLLKRGERERERRLLDDGYFLLWVGWWWFLVRFVNISTFEGFFFFGHSFLFWRRWRWWRWRRLGFECHGFFFWDCWKIGGEMWYYCFFFSSGYTGANTYTIRTCICSYFVLIEWKYRNFYPLSLVLSLFFLDF